MQDLNKSLDNKKLLLSFSPQEKLWEAVLAGDIDMIVSDHSPCTPDLKMPGEKDFMAAWGGISSLQFGQQTFHHETKLNLEVCRSVLVLEPGGGQRSDCAADEQASLSSPGKAGKVGSL